MGPTNRPHGPHGPHLMGLMGPTAVMFVIVLVSVHNKSHDTLAYTHGSAHKRC